MAAINTLRRTERVRRVQKNTRDKKGCLVLYEAAFLLKKPKFYFLSTMI
jgi:hypothetical protein